MSQEKSERTRLQFFIMAEGMDKTTSVMVKRVRELGDEAWHVFPDDCQRVAFHKKLLELGPIKGAVNSLRARGQFRTITVTPSSEVLKLYMDEEGNFVFNEFYLPELGHASEITNIPSPLYASSTAADKEESVKSILKHFMVEKFSTKNKNVISWVKSFEKECTIFQLSGRRQMEVFKACLDASVLDWFGVTQLKLGLNTDWKQWKHDLISTFGDDSWTPISFAYLYRYLNGSFVDFAVKKERMLLELERDLSDQTVLDLIIIGLPSHIKSSLKRSQITSVELLRNKLKKFDTEDTSKFKSTNNKQFNFTIKKSEEEGKNIKVTSSNLRKPCLICEKKGFSGRFHPEGACWNRDKGGNNNKKVVNNVEVEPLPNDIEQKN